MLGLDLFGKTAIESLAAIEPARFEVAGDSEFDQDLEELEIMKIRAKTFMHQFHVDQAETEYSALLLQAKYQENEEYQLVALDALASISQFKGDVPELSERSRAILELGADDSRRSNAYTYLSSGHLLNNNLDSAEFYILKAIEIDSISKDKSSLPFTLAKRAEIHQERGESFNAIDRYIQATEILRPDTDDFKLASLDYSIALIFLDMGMLDRAGEYLDEASQMATEHDLNSLTADIHVAKGLLAWRKKDSSAALAYLKAGLLFFQDAGKNQRIEKTKDLLARILLENGDISEAREYIGEELHEESWSESSLSRLLTQGRLFLIEKKYDRVEKLLAHMETREAEIALRDSLDILGLEYELLIEQGELEKALAVNEALIGVQESMTKKSREYEIHRIEKEFAHHRELEKIALLEAQKENDAQSIAKREKWLMSSVILGALMLVLILLLAYHIRKLRIAKELAKERADEFALLVQEKELLLAEIQHRVKNNMQVISSLLRMQSRDTANKDAKDAVMKSRNRIRSLSLINQSLYKKERVHGVNAKEYIEKLSSSVFNAYKVDTEKVKLITDIEDIEMHVDTGIPVGLILNELLTNCLTYAFPGSEEGEVTIRLRQEDKKLILEVQDSGASLSEEQLSIRVGSFGSKMVEAFKKKLDAQIDLSTDGANRVCLSISNLPIKD